MDQITVFIAAAILFNIFLFMLLMIAWRLLRTQQEVAATPGETRKQPLKRFTPDEPTLASDKPDNDDALADLFQFDSGTVASTNGAVGRHRSGRVDS